MSDVLSSPFFGIVLTCLAWCAAQWAQKKTGSILCNPLAVATALIIVFLLAFRIPYDAYAQGGDLLILMQGPVTAVLALNIYRQRSLLGKYFLPLTLGCLAGCLTSVGCVAALCRLMSLDAVMTASLLPKSVTTAIAIAIADSHGGVPGIATASILLTGIEGAMFAPLFAKLFHITDPVAEGAAIGACSHGLGTTKAMEIGQLQGAMSSISLCICGIITSALSLFFS